VAPPAASPRRGTQGLNLVDGDFTRDGGYAPTSRLLDPAQAECVFAVNDVLALGGMSACRDRGLTVPDDLAVAGFVDVTTLRDVCPSRPRYGFRPRWARG
jgi:LacI family transcriptional regulator